MERFLQVHLKYITYVFCREWPCHRFRHKQVHSVTIEIKRTRSASCGQGKQALTRLSEFSLVSPLTIFRTRNQCTWIDAHTHTLAHPHKVTNWNSQTHKHTEREAQRYSHPQEQSVTESLTFLLPLVYLMSFYHWIRTIEMSESQSDSGRKPLMHWPKAKLVSTNH